MSLALIVEEDGLQAERTSELARRRGFRPALARNGESALTLARLLQPDVVLINLLLPDTDGFELCRRLRSDERTISTPIILMTDLDNSTERRRGFRVGANAYLAKPFTPSELGAAVDAALAWRAGLEKACIRGEIHVELNSEAEFLADVNEFLTHLCRRTPLTEEQLMHLRQSFMEMGLNAIEWGNRQHAEKLVTITYRVFADRVEIVVRDQGAGFDRAALPHAATPDDPLAHLEVRERLGLREGGFGLMIARGMLDELRYNERGNEVTLIKRFPPASGPSGRAEAEAPGPALRGSPVR